MIMAGNNPERFGIAHIQNAHEPLFDLCFVRFHTDAGALYTQAQISLTRPIILFFCIFLPLSASFSIALRSTSPLASLLDVVCV